MKPRGSALNPKAMHIVHQSQLPFVGMSYEFVGQANQGVGISFFVVLGEPGLGPKLHKHPYDEIVYVIEGRSKWTIADREVEARAGDILIARAGEPHKFINSGDGPLRQLDIHVNPVFESTWLED